MVRLCVCLCTTESIQGTVQRSHGAWGVSHLSLHTLSHAQQHCLSSVTHTRTLTPRTNFTSVSPANRQDHVLIWNQYLALASKSVWSPTSFSALAGRKWPNIRAPVLRWTHCCHIKAQICTVAQLKFPTLPLLCTPSPTPLEQMQSWITVCFEHHGVSMAAHWYQWWNLIGRLIRNQTIEEEKTIEATAVYF